MSIKYSFVHDVIMRSNIKLAGLEELRPYLTNALLGGSILSAFTAAPALLHAYANDEDALKTLADTTKYSLPIGALVGAGATGVNQLSSMFKDTLSTFGKDLIQTADNLTGKLSETSKNLHPLASEASDVLNSLKSIPEDIVNSILG